MAIVAGSVSFTGSMGDLSAYRMKGTDKIVLRRKGGVSKQRIKQHPHYDLTRRNNEEWKACIAAGNTIRAAIYAVKHLADYNFSGDLHAICKSIQIDDGVNEKGRRSVLLSQAQYKLEGFGLNRFNSFDSILRHPLQYGINRDDATASIVLPDIIPGINLYNPNKQPLYRFVAILGVVPDIVYDNNHRVYVPAINDLPHHVTIATDWYASNEGSAASELSLSINNWQNVEGSSLLLSVGIEFGKPISQTVIRNVKYAGAAKILKLVS